MQQTEKYKLNLIEPSDPFMPEGLNQNTQKIENVLSTHIAQTDAKVAGLTKSLGTHGHTARIVYGSYIGDGQCGQAHPTVISLDFYPVLLSIYYTSTESVTTFRGMRAILGRPAASITWNDKSISIYDSDATRQFNWSGTTYTYMVIGYELDS